VRWNPGQIPMVSRGPLVTTNRMNTTGKEIGHIPQLSIKRCSLTLKELDQPSGERSASIEETFVIW